MRRFDQLVVEDASLRDPCVCAPRRARRRDPLRVRRGADPRAAGRGGAVAAVGAEPSPSLATCWPASCRRAFDAHLLDPVTLSDVAAVVGLQDHAHLTRRFKRFLGTTVGRFAHTRALRESEANSRENPRGADANPRGVV